MTRILQPISVVLPLKDMHHPAKGPLQAYKFASEITVNLKKKKGEFVQSKVKDLYAGAHGFLW